MKLEIRKTEHYKLTYEGGCFIVSEIKPNANCRIWARFPAEFFSTTEAAELMPETRFNHVYRMAMLGYAYM